MGRPEPAGLEQIGKYRILAELGRGGFGRLYRAYDPSIPREVAIKVLHSPNDERLLRRFQKEAAAAGRLHHRNIVTVFDFGVQDQMPFMVMELLEGRDLSELIGSNIPLWQTMDIMQQVARGLNHAHRRGVIHRDVTPSNVRLLPDGTVKIIDFGVAAIQADSRESSLHDRPVSLMYLSPEHFSNVEPDHRADIFAYGVIYYQLISGKHPFDADNPQVIACNIALQDPPPLRQIAPSCPEALEQIVNRALQKHLERRYQSLQDIEIDIEPILLDQKRERAGMLVAEARKLYEDGQLASAHAVLSEALEFDARNDEARELRERVSHELEQAAILEEIHGLLARAEDALLKRQFLDAVRTLEAAIRLDSGNAEAITSLERARAASLIHERVKQTVRIGWDELVAGNYDLAFDQARQAIDVDSSHPAPHALMSAVQEAINASQQKLRAQLDAFYELIRICAFDQAFGVLLEVGGLFPDDPLVTAAGIDLRAAEEAHRELQERLKNELAAAKHHLAGQQFQEAATLLNNLNSAFPESTEVAQLLEYATTEINGRLRMKAIEVASSEARRHAAFGEFDQALKVLESALRSYPGDSTLMRMLQATARMRQRYGQGPNPEHEDRSPYGGVAVQQSGCTACGAPLIAEMKFCDNCGARLHV